LPESVTDAVTVWVPTEREVVEKDAPDPMAPSRELVQVMDAERAPSSASAAEAEKEMLAPCVNEALLAGVAISTVGAVLTGPPPPPRRRCRRARRRR
jgi:hypothetical protein